MLEETLNSFSVINNTEEILNEDYKWFAYGNSASIKKDAFSDEPEADHFNFDSFLADSLSSEIKDVITHSFLLNGPKSYLLKPEDIFVAIEKLQINNDYVIIVFGVNLSYYIESLKINGLNENSYKNIDIISFQGSRTVNESFFIIKKTDLPNINTREIDPLVIVNLDLKKISDIYNIYASVIDLNHASQEIINEQMGGMDETESKKYVLLSIIFSLEIRWKKNINVIQLNQYSDYGQKGLPNKLSEIEPIVEKPQPEIKEGKSELKPDKPDDIKPDMLDL